MNADAPGPAAESSPAVPHDPEQLRAHAARAAELLRVLASPHRLMVVCVLVEGERTVGELNARIALGQSALSQHLAVLRRAGVVTTRREGRRIHYAVAPGVATDIVARLYQAYCAPAAGGSATDGD